jgi:hypothetical protein
VRGGVVAHAGTPFVSGPFGALFPERGGFFRRANVPPFSSSPGRLFPLQKSRDFTIFTFSHGKLLSPRSFLKLRLVFDVLHDPLRACPVRLACGGGPQPRISTDSALSAPAGNWLNPFALSNTAHLPPQRSRTLHCVEGHPRPALNLSFSRGTRDPTKTQVCAFVSR